MRPARPDSYRRLGVGAIALLTVLALVGGGYWWTHPQALSHGAEIGGELAVGETQVFDIADHLAGYDETSRVLRIEPHIVRDETAARYEFVTCVLKDADDGIGATDEGDIPRLCASTRPTAGASFGLQDGRRSQLLMKLTATKPGRLEIDGADVTYRRSGRHLFQTGTQQSGTVMKLTAK
ncbi:hypothetical protein [Aeromicrobium duanguangcaii]|uniref:Uncharacterized protein n=1 Tax=Aeromicrobium duanguangcaii TaxID=2968086 RepID=A0ABY5KHJ9_9ACTN|nr:hypothetical protein [Aeromicrobium duanguangcaii]MCD9152952.1 hypothetical protein [Aeromicrobium duanguangcaii]UUI69942.1 hypothetical protein NP095_07565 [Aeromicrobium duanguangcaii]